MSDRAAARSDRLLAHGSRITLPFVGLVGLLALAIGGVAVWLVGRAVENRLRDQVRDTATLVAGGHFPLHDQTLVYLARYIRAEIVLAVGTRIQATTLDTQAAHAFEGALESGAVRRSTTDVSLDETAVGSSKWIVGSVASGVGARDLYLLYPPELEEAERSRATSPVLVVAIVGVAFTALLGGLKERAAVRERMRDYKHLVSALAHEVKNPLGAIRLTVETLRDVVPPNEREAVDVVTSEVERLALLVDELRILGSGGRAFEPVAVRPRDAVFAILSLLRRSIEHRGLVLEAPTDDRALDTPVLVDPRALKQALLNLLLNAIDASPPSGTIRVTVSLATAGFVLFLVEDGGTGVPADVRRRLFQPFVSTKEGGTGLGLALAKFVADEHGGSLELLARERTTFALELPRASSEGGVP